MYRKSGNNRKRQERYQNKKRENPAPREAYGLIQHLNNRNKASNIWTYKSRVVRKDLVSVYVKRSARAYKQYAQNNNKINCRQKITIHDKQITER